MWLTWRRHRFAILALTLLALALVGYLATSNAPARAALYRVTNGQSPASCMASQSQSVQCQQLTAQWNDTYNDPGDLFGWLGVMLAPVVIGMFLGAPLVAGELEAGTQRLAWTQGVSRRRWLLTLVGAQLGVALLLMGAVELATWYWTGSHNLPGSNFTVFDMIGAVPFAYTGFALALGLALGALTRRAVPAMLLTLVGYLAVRLPSALYLRPYYLPPLTLTWDPYVTRNPSSQPAPQDWVLSSGWLNAQGEPLGGTRGFLGVPAGGPSPYPDTCSIHAPLASPLSSNVWQGWDTFCTHTYGWRYSAVWQPASRFWLFQGIESVIFLTLAVALIALTLWLIRRVVA